MAIQFLKDTENGSLVEQLENSVYARMEPYKFPKQVQGKATVSFTSQAYAKTMTLVKGFDTEVAWHATVEKLGKGSYRVLDVLTYPHKVTAMTVTADPQEILEWRDSLDDDTFNKLRFWGHSHVNMGVSPSSVDIEGQKPYVSQLLPNMFYIFGIFNKRGNFSMRIYDREDNIIYDTRDVNLRVELDIGMDAFLKEAKEKVKIG